jgi:PAS domain S-box-containing protein
VNISTQLKFAGLFSAVVVVVIGAVLLSATQQVKQELVKNEVAEEVLKGVTALRHLTLEYVLHHEERAHAQWQLRHASLSTLLTSTTEFEFTGKEEQEIIDGLRHTHESVNALFSQLAENYKDRESNQRANAVLEEFEARLVGQITNKTQAMISDALDLSERSRTGVRNAQHRTSVAGGAFAGVVVLMILAMSYLMFRSVIVPLGKLREGTATVGAGNLDFRIGIASRDEIGELARAFDGMTEKLKATTVSRAELVKVNEVLQLERGKLAAAFENMEMGLVLSNGQGGDMSMNAAALKFHGFNSTEDMHRRVEEYAAEWELRYPDGRIMPFEEWPLPRAMRGDHVRDYETHLRNLKTGYVWVCSYTSAPVRNSAGEVILIVMTLVDVTQRVQAEQKAQAQRERAETLLQAVPDPVVIVDRDGRIVVVNGRTEAVFGYPRAELLGQPVELLIPQRLHAAHVAQRAPYQKAPSTRAMGEGRELFARRKDGSEFAVDISLSPLVTSEGTLIISTIRDVTERKQAERRIRGQLEHLNLLDHITRATGERQDLKSIFQVVVRSLEDSLPIDFGCVCVYDAVANALTVTSVGVKSEALAHELTMDEKATIGIDSNGLGRCVQGHLVYEPDIAQVRFPFPERLARGGLGSVVMAPLKSESRVFGVLVAARREAQGFSSVECEFLRQLSEHVALAAHQAQLYGALQQAYDDLRQTQQAMMQEERLKALGQMASGIAHDINNALSPVSLYAESMLETERNLSDRARGYLETIQRAVEDVAQTVARMREFYRPREAQLGLTPVQMNSMVQQVVDLTRARWSDQPQQRGIMIRVLTELAPDLPKSMGVESEIREALTNLVFNAVDAMPKGGALTLRTRVADAGSERAAVVVEVADNGIGMDEETRRRCLEPFFTTKGELGTGLGLAMVFGMVQRHSAEIEIESAPGAGTIVRLVFAVPTAIVAEPGRPAEALKALSRLRLLLIDDDPILLKSLRDALETDGHVIVTANSGEAGISTFRASLDRGEPFAAVITDLGMPYVDGRQVAAAVKETSPATPVIMLTGWGQRLMAEGDIPPHVDRMLAKPPKLRDVREALAQLCRPAAT